MLASILEIPGRDFDRVGSGLFAYLFGLIDRTGFYEYTGDRALARSVLCKARESGYVLKDCKLYAHAHYIARAQGQAPRPKDYGITRKDSNFLKRLNVKTDQFTALSIEQFDRLISQSLMTSDMQAYIGKLISKKMTFLIRSYGETRDNLESKLISAALYALYKQYPRYESALHAKNICKTTIHNTAMNIIQHHTRGKRQALTRGLDGTFEAVNVPLDAVFDIAQEAGFNSKELIRDLAVLQDRMSHPVQNFLNAALGVYNEDLSAHMGVDNSVAVDNMHYDRYLRSLQAYFQVTEQQTQKLFAKLRPHLA